ncbi:hypothetical protein DFJ63DRAFT_333058 [Scheffersomyces coipomensis]|uniref:uncharacterized protein n=1 Tax=Scheffersomyces coipomensis TaxID=1788519 RepID=UPI00315D496B
MLGRLFKQTPTNSLNNHHHGLSSNNPSPSPSVPNPTNPSLNNPSFDDSYAREILYGTHNPNQLKPYQFNNKFFRVIVSQDGGSLRSKQVLYDSSLSEASLTPSPSSSINTITGGSYHKVTSPVSPIPPPSPYSSSSSSYSKHNHKTIIPSKIYHNSNELNDYMFGCGVPSNEINCSTKLHVLPSINNLIGGPYNAVLITRLFSICDVENTDPHTDISSINSNINWHPTSALPIGATNIKKFPFFRNLSSSSNPIIPTTTNSKSSSNINSRFSIGIVIPLDSLNDINDVIVNNWDEISHFLILLQKSIYKKLLSILNNNCLYDNENNLCSCSYLINKRIQFPNYILQNDLDLNNQMLKLIKLIHYDSNIPKLINTNSLMKSCLIDDNTQYNSVFLNWVLETLNWLEFKDGKSFLQNATNNSLTNYNSNSSFHTTNTGSTDLTSYANNNTFLASLLALLIPMRQSLSVKPYHNVTDSKVREVTRVVLMTGNPVVAKKLIFIINGIVPDSNTPDVDDYEVNHLEQKQQQQQQQRQQPDLRHQEDSQQHIPQNKTKSFEYDENDCSTSPKSKRPYPPPRLPSTFSNTSSGSNNNVTTPSSPAKSINPIPIKRSTQFSTSVSSSDNSFGRSSPTAKGWEIPGKSVASTSTSTPNRENIEVSVHNGSITKGIPIVLPVNATSKAQISSSLSKSSSLAYLSSSLSSSYSSSYSLPKIGSSFMDKWKNSISSVYAGSSSGVPHHGNGSISSNYGYDGDYFPPPPTTFGSIPKRNSIQSLRSPSPAIEQEEFTWTTHSANIPIAHSNGNSSQNGMGNVMSNIYGSTPNKLSRTQSMYDLYNMNNEILEESYNESNNLSDENFSSSNTIKVNSSSNSNPNNSNNGNHNSTLNKNLAIKRSKTSVYSPLIDDNLIKNVNEHNKTIIQSKCEEIMKMKFQDPTAASKKETHILEISPIIHNEKSFVDIDEAESLINDQSTISSGFDNLDLGNDDGGEGLSSHPIFKHLALSPNVAFSDEFRSEFNIQSCPVNPKLETQVMSAMRNDLLFYQNNFDYSKIVSRTVFISLRAREIKLIEMTIDNDAYHRASFSTANPPKPETPSNGSNPQISSSLSSPLGSYFPDTSLFHMKKNSEKPNNNYKTKTLKVFTPAKNLGNLELINKVDNTFEEINQLFNLQQQYRTKQQQRQQQQQSSQQEKADKTEGFHDFNKKLSKLVLSLV